MPDLARVVGAEAEFTYAWIMDEDDPRPGEWVLKTDDPRFGSSWLPESDLEILEKIEKRP